MMPTNPSSASVSNESGFRLIYGRAVIRYHAALMPRRAILPVLVTLITVYGGLLRLESLHARYGWMERPSWVAAMEARAVPVARHLRPPQVTWGPDRDGYVGGDPINYLAYARDMQSFYQAHVREPVFLALTRGFLEAMENKDVALSYASGTAATLAIPATYLLGSLWSPLIGLGAAAALAIEFDAITWSVDGWRDDTFMLLVTLTTWALIKLRRDPAAAHIALAGVTAALACLTRLSALSFVVPGLLYAALRNDVPQPRAARRVAIAAIVTLALVLPYVVNCARATGDPFYAVNYHTRYYRAAERLAPDESVSALQYVSSKFTSRPVHAIDTAAVGLLVFPYRNKWHGFRPWSPLIGPALFWCGIAGLLLALAVTDGRLVWLILITSLIPYAMTWSVGGGGEWRFTQHVYPLYLVAAFGAIVAAGWAVTAAVRGQLNFRRDLSWRRAAAIAGVAAAVALGYAWYRFAPLIIFREAIAAGEPASIVAGQRDAVFFSGGWSDPRPEGAIAVRAALADRVSVRVPVPRRGSDYLVTVRVDPAETAEPAVQPKVTAYFNGRVAAQLHLTRQEGRVGTYRFTVPADMTDWRIGRLDFVSTHTVQASDAGRHFNWLPPTAPVAFRLWYVRVEPVASSQLPASGFQLSASSCQLPGASRFNRVTRTGNWGTGNWKLGTGSWKLEAGSYLFTSIESRTSPRHGLSAAARSS